MRHLIKITAAGIFAAALSSQVAYAQDAEFYVDGTIGQLSADAFDFTVVNGHWGFKYGKYFGLEAEVGLGLGEEDVNFSDFNLENEVSMLISEAGAAGLNIDADVKLNHKLGGFVTLGTNLNGLEVFGRVGVIDAEFKVTGTGTFEGITASSSETQGGTALAYGVGGKYYFSGQNGIRLDVLKYDIDDVDTTEFSVGYTRKF